MFLLTTTLIEFLVKGRIKITESKHEMLFGRIQVVWVLEEFQQTITIFQIRI